MSIFNLRKKNSSVVALNISDRSLEAVKITKEGDRCKLLALSRLEIEAGIIEDGKVIRPEPLAAAIRQLMHQAKPLPLRDKDLVITIPESKIFSLASEIPATAKDQELIDIIRHRAAEVIPVEPELLIFDYVINRGVKTEIFYAATYQALIQDYVKVFDSLKLRLRFIGMESQALARAVITPGREDNILLLDIGARSTIASIFSRGFIRETANLAIAGDAITAALARDFQVGVEEIEQIKEQRGLTLSEDNVYREVIIKVIDDLAVEIQKFYTFWRGRSSETVTEVILAGGSSQLPGLAEYLQVKLNLPVRLGELPVELTLDKAQLNVQKFLPVIGVALLNLSGDKGAINFLKIKPVSVNKKNSTTVSPSLAVPEPVTPKHEPIPLWRLLILIFLLLMSLGVFGFFWWRSTAPTSFIHSPPDIADQSMAASFILDVGSVSGVADIIPARAERRILNGQIQLTAVYWQRINNNARSEGRDINNRQQMYNYVLTDLVAKIWRDNYANLASQYQRSGSYLLDTYPTYEVTTSTPPSADWQLNQDQAMSLAVNYALISLSEQDFQQTLTNQWQSKFQAPLPSSYSVSQTHLAKIDVAGNQYRATITILPEIK
ncbi:MAG: pilus assembly protein PilM [Candidatus Komeilibacteria bacterium]